MSFVEINENVIDSKLVAAIEKIKFTSSGNMLFASFLVHLDNGAQIKIARSIKLKDRVTAGDGSALRELQGGMEALKIKLTLAVKANKYPS